MHEEWYFKKKHSEAGESWNSSKHYVIIALCLATIIALLAYALYT